MLRTVRQDISPGGRTSKFDHVKSKLKLRSNSNIPSKMEEIHKKRAKTNLEILNGNKQMTEHKQSFIRLMQHCVNTTREHNAEDLYRPIDREVMRVDQEQYKLNEAYKIIEDAYEITDLAFSNRLFMYKNEVSDQNRAEVRRLKDEYREYMADYTRPAAKLELKYKAPKHLVRQTKFIHI